MSTVAFPNRSIADFRRWRTVRYGAAVLMTGAALAIKLFLVTPITNEDEPFLLFFGAVMASAAFGVGPGLLATALAGLADNYFFVPPLHQFGFTNTDQKVRLTIFIAEGICISIIFARLGAARQRAEDSAAEARELERRILETSEEEQRRIGHDLHDGLGQHLTGIALMARRLEHHLQAAGSPDAGEGARLSELAKTAVSLTHDLCRTLSPSVLESDGLPEALRELAANVESIFRVDCTFEETGNTVPVALGTGVHLYRIAQEAISNAIRHGKAKHVRLRLEPASDNGIVIRIIDDGAGIDAAKGSSDGMGLRIMRYRARMIGAEVDVRRREEGGTEVACRYIPSEENPAAVSKPSEALS